MVGSDLSSCVQLRRWAISLVRVQTAHDLKLEAGAVALDFGACLFALAVGDDKWCEKQSLLDVDCLSSRALIESRSCHFEIGGAGNHAVALDPVFSKDPVTGRSELSSVNLFIRTGAETPVMQRVFNFLTVS